MPRLSCSEVHLIPGMGKQSRENSISGSKDATREAGIDEKSASSSTATPTSTTTKRGKCFKVAITIFPVVIWLLFLIAGGFLFSRIEGPYLVQFRQAEKDYYSQLIFQAWERGRLCNDSSMTLATMNSSGVTECQIEDIVDLIVMDLHQDKGLEWNFMGGFHFCLTVVSTIGYGILVPKTHLGRVLCIIYAVIGIPLNITLIGWVGRGIVYLITKFYQYLYNLRASCRAKRGRRVDVRPPRSVSTLSIIGATHMKQTRLDSGSGSRCSTNNNWVDPETGGRETSCRLNKQEQSGTPNPGGGGDNEGFTSTSPRSTPTHSTQMRVLLNSNGGVPHGEGRGRGEDTIVGVEDDGPIVQETESESIQSNNNSTDGEITKKGVPMWFAALFFILYLCLTTLLIYYSGFVPNEWGLIDSFYFDIVTILTVGFGDMFYYTRGQTLTEQQKTSAGMLSITMMILGMLMLSIFLSFAVDAFTLNNMKKCVDSVFVSCWERIFCRKRKRKKSKPPGGQ